MTPIGIDLGGTQIKMGILKGSNILVTSQIEAKAGQKMSIKLLELRDAVDQLLKTHQIDP